MRFENPSHHQRVFDRPSIIVPPPPDLRKAPRAVKRSRRGIRFADLKKRRSHSASGQLEQDRVEHLSRQPPAPKVALYRDVQKLGLFAHRERDHISDNFEIRRISNYMKDSRMTAE